jgi:hypothetical protein
MQRLKTVISDPTLEHLDKKIFAWLLCAVLIGVIAGIALSDFDDEKDWRNYRYRSMRSMMRTARPALRSGRRRTVCYKD